ncbi:MAG: tetratricopeptide repeat protein [Candidatus Aegiribacteria sp.]|nr:tetratricopeptide repeat protein [Candidatus Aegiribacteria sp.]
MNPFIPGDIDLIRQGKYLYSGSLLFADISGFTELTEKLALHGKKGTEDLTEILNRYFRVMYGIVREHGGINISSAGDSMLVRFSENSDSSACAEKMMTEIVHFENLKTDAGICRLGIKIILGYGTWTEFIIGDEKGAHIFLAGDIIEKMAAAEDAAVSGETVSVRSEEAVVLDEYTLPDLPDSSFIIPGTENLQGEHRSITAVFVNFTGYDAKEPPHRQIQELYLGISDIAQRNSGIVQMVDNNLVGGSRFFLLFGAPRSYGYDLLHAVQASLEIRQYISSQSVFSIRTGIDEGFAFAGAIGDVESRKYTVIGDVVNTAARLADSAESGSIAVSDNVFRISRNNYKYQNMKSINLKGKESPVKRYLPIERRIDPGDSYHFVGREEELSGILSTITGENSVIVVQGGAGIGKTSLLKKLSELLIEKSYNVLYGSSPENSETNDLFASLIGNISGMLESDPRETRKNKLRNLISELGDPGGSLSKREVFLGRMLFSLSYPGSDYDALPPILRRENLLDGICEMIRSCSKPLCVILEDIHHSTDVDILAVEYIARHLLAYSDVNISFVISKRPDERTLFNQDDVPIRRMLLEGLDNSASDELMLEILNGTPLEKCIDTLIRERADGNPFYLTQFLLYLVEEKLISRKDDLWERTAQYNDEKLPGNVFTMIMARIDRLEKQAKECLRIGSVAGFRFEEEIVRRVLMRNVHDNLMDCTEAGLTYRSKLKHMEFVFSHTLIKDVSYDSILRKRRKKIHGDIGSVLEEMYPDSLEALCSSLASHFRISEEWERALKYSYMAGCKAWAEYRNLNAIQHFQDAADISESHLSSTSDQLAECCRYIGKIHDRMGNYDEALKYYRKALETTTEIELTGDVSLAIADINYTRGEVDRSIELLDNIEDMLIQNPGKHEILFVRIECFRAWVYCVMGDNELAMKKALKAVDLAENLCGCDEIVCAHQRGFSYNTIATVHWANGDYAEARKFYLKALEIAMKHNMKREIAVTYGNIGLISSKLGEYADAIDSLNKQLTASKEIGDKLIVMTSYGELSKVYSSTGLFDKALEVAEKYRVQAEELPAVHDIILACHQLGALHLAKGRLDEARELGETALELSGKSYEREEAYSLALLGLIAIEEEDEVTAEHRLREAEILARKIHAKSLLLDVLVTLSDLHLKNGRSGGISEMIAEANDLVEEMGMTAGRAKIYQLQGKLYFSLEEFEKGSIEFDRAIGIFEHYGMKPALADTLISYCGMLDLKKNISGEESDRQKNRMAKALELEKEMGIHVNKRSALLLII